MSPSKSKHITCRFDEHQSEAKSKRKMVVDQMNRWLDKNDRLQGKIEEVFEKVKK